MNKIAELHHLGFYFLNSNSIETIIRHNKKSLSISQLGLRKEHYRCGCWSLLHFYCTAYSFLGKKALTKSN